MFTGLVKETASVAKIESSPNQCLKLWFQDLQCYPSAQVGDSIAVNGCCLTVVDRKEDWLSFECSPETIAKTVLGKLREGDRVHIEPALSLGDPLGGHMVSGHVDGLATVNSLEFAEGCLQLRCSFPSQWSAWVVEKGSVCLQGVSLTVNTLDRGEKTTTIGLTLIPLTLKKTNFSDLQKGQLINIEFDMVAKQIASLCEPYLGNIKGKTIG